MPKGMTKTRNPGVYKRDKDGRLIAYVGVSVDGKTVYRKSTLDEGASVQDAVREAARLREAIRTEAEAPVTPGPLPLGTSPARRADTVEDFARDWLRLKQSRMKASAYKHYERLMNERILPRIGWVPVSDVCRSMVESWVAWAENETQADGSPYRKPTLRGWYRVLVGMLRDLAADYDLPDPCRRIRPPQPKVAQPPLREQDTLSVSEVATLLNTIRRLYPQRYAEVAVMAYTGMRAGEVYGLCWDVVDFDKGRIEIKRTVSEGDLIEGTKTKAPRVVPIHPALADALQEHRQELLKSQHRGLRTGLVFPSDLGGPRVPQSLRKALDGAAQVAGITTRVTPQVLRRTFNTLMVSAGIDPIAVRAMMGHNSVAMTELYSGVPLDAKKAAVAMLFPPSAG